MLTSELKFFLFFLRGGGGFCYFFSLVSLCICVYQSYILVFSYSNYLVLADGVLSVGSLPSDSTRQLLVTFGPAGCPP